jgi:hypothetical protein
VIFHQSSNKLKYLQNCVFSVGVRGRPTIPCAPPARVSKAGPKSGRLTRAPPRTRPGDAGPCRILRRLGPSHLLGLADRAGPRPVHQPLLKNL